MSNSVLSATPEQHPPLTFLMRPAVDRVIAFLAIVPFAWFAYARYRVLGFNLPWVVLVIGVSVLIATMLVRRTPVRISTNPWYWLLTFVETYWGVLTVALLVRGRPLLPDWATDAAALFSLALVLWARFSLGRSIGLVPALRKLVMHGPYHYIRHPIYASLVISYSVVALRSYSPRNALLIGLGIFWFWLKCLVEERFLRTADPAYAVYMQEVRYRWIPGLF